MARLVGPGIAGLNHRDEISEDFFHPDKLKNDENKTKHIHDSKLKTMMKKVALLWLIVFAIGCKKENNLIKKSPFELLTQKEWILSAAGFDDNSNGVLDPAENTIQDCHKDNSYVFHPAGTGSFHDNALSCGGPDTGNFQWKLLNNDTELEIEFERSLILRLNEQEMILNLSMPGLAVKFILIYKH